MKSKSITPLFLFSLPRSGSTLLQRVLASHEKIETKAEPWFLLPMFYAARENGVYAEYSHRGAFIALRDYTDELPNQKDDYFEAVRQAAYVLYNKALESPETTRFFLDKTPRYSLISEEIIQTFPEAKYIILWRNPLSVVTSIVETWGKGLWDLDNYKVDVFLGQMSLLKTYEKHRGNLLAIQYESFIEAPLVELEKIGSYLGIEFSEAEISAFSDMVFEGKMGDQKGTQCYNAVSSQSLDKWKATVCNPWRKRWCKKYLFWLGEERLKVMGYDINVLYSELDEIPLGFRYLGRDLFLALYSVFYSVFSLTILKNKIKNLANWKSIVNHS